MTIVRLYGLVSDHRQNIWLGQWPWAGYMAWSMTIVRLHGLVNDHGQVIWLGTESIRNWQKSNFVNFLDFASWQKSNFVNFPDFASLAIITSTCPYYYPNTWLNSVSVWKIWLLISRRMERIIPLWTLNSIQNFGTAARNTLQPGWIQFSTFVEYVLHAKLNYKLRKYAKQWLNSVSARHQGFSTVCKTYIHYMSLHVDKLFSA